MREESEASKNRWTVCHLDRVNELRHGGVYCKLKLVEVVGVS